MLYSLKQVKLTNYQQASLADSSSFFIVSYAMAIK
jgi:hypothetical protein